MTVDCNVIRDLLPLYADKVCSEESRRLVETHLQDCPQCRETARLLQDTRLESALYDERNSVLAYGAREFRRRSALIGSAVSGSLTIPVLVCLGLILFGRPQISWIAVVLAGFCVLASLIAVPIIVREDKLFWTFCAFTASLILLLGVICLYSHGNWFGVAASALLFGLSLIFLPFLIRAAPVKRILGRTNKLLIVLGVDFALFFNLLVMIDTQGRFSLNRLLFVLGSIAGIACVIVGIIRNRKTDGGAVR